MDKFKFEVSPEHMNVIFAALGKLPLEQTIDTFMALRSQVEQQSKQQPLPTPAE